jgi:peptidoglycan/LPS O-acetylase OafA/YrhL
MWPRFAAFFLMGVCCYLYRDLIPRSRLLFWGALFFFMASAFCFRGLSFTGPFVGAYLLLYIAFHPRIQFHDFARSGDFSYGMYLYGWPIQQLLKLYFQPHLTPTSLFVWAVLFSACAAALSWRFVEKPALSLKPRSLKLPLGDLTDRIQIIETEA